MIRILIMLALLSLPGCYRVPAERLAISTEFTAEEIAEITAAADSWCVAAGRCLELVVADEPRPDAAWIVPADPEWCAGGPRLGQTYGAGFGTVEICTGFAFRRTAAHEIGHLLHPGNGHVEDDPRALMYATDEPGGSEVPTPADLEWLDR